jgi:hypothetical protein
MRLLRARIVLSLSLLFLCSAHHSLAETRTDSWLGAFCGINNSGKYQSGHSTIAVLSKRFRPSFEGNALAVLDELVIYCRDMTKGRALLNTRIETSVGDMSKSGSDKQAITMYPGSLLITVYGDCVLEVQDAK